MRRLDATRETRFADRDAGRPRLQDRAASPSVFSLKAKRVWVAGHRGMIGEALVRRLAMAGAEVLAISRGGLDLRRQLDVEGWIQANAPDAVVLAAATTGAPNEIARRPADFLYDNIAIAQNVIDGSWRAGVKRLLVLSPSSIYPPAASEPVREDALLGGPPAPLVEADAIARIAAVKLVEAYRAQHGAGYICAAPTGVYGPGVGANRSTTGPVTALMARLIQARQADAATLSFAGAPSAPLAALHVRDLADACAFILERYDGPGPLHVGGASVDARELVQAIAAVVGYDGGCRFDPDTVDPAASSEMRLDTAVLDALGWRPSIPLAEGLRDAYFWLQSAQPDLFGDVAAA